MTPQDDFAHLGEAWARFTQALYSVLHIPQLAAWLASKITRKGEG